MKTDLKLANWMLLEEKFKAAQNAINECTKEVMSLMVSQKRLDGEKAENTICVLSALLGRCDSAHSTMHSQWLHPQSEWTGGNPDDPKNHTFREPNIVGLGAGHFSREEIEESMECFGPCKWERK